MELKQIWVVTNKDLMLLLRYNENFLWGLKFLYSDSNKIGYVSLEKDNPHLISAYDYPALDSIQIEVPEKWAINLSCYRVKNLHLLFNKNTIIIGSLPLGYFTRPKDLKV